MSRRTILVAALVVAATVAVGAGGVAAEPRPDTQRDAQTDDPRTDRTNESQQYRGIEPSRDWVDKPVLETEVSGESAAAERNSGSASGDFEGTERQFLTSGPAGYQLTDFTLYHVGDNVEVWVATDLSWGVAGDRETPSISQEQAAAIADQFDENIYPTESELFGTPAPRNGSEALLGPEGYYDTGPGSGNRTALLVQNIRDENYYDPSYPLYVAGYYSPTVQTYSDRNVITIDAYGWENVTGDDPTVGYEGTLAHEYQHLIHGDLDGDETTWVNEGLSDLAETATGYGVPESHLSAYEQNPSNSLTNWEDQGPLNILADYGEAYAFTMYLQSQYGEEFIHDLANDEANGIRSVERQVAATGDSRDFYELYQDFATAAVVDTVDGPRKAEYDIEGVDVAVNTSTDAGTAGAWGTNYRTVDTAGEGPIAGATVSGTEFVDTEWTTVETDAGPAIYSGSGNLLDRHAVREVDLSDAENPTLTFETNYIIEPAWDYGFVQVSTDGGETWQSLSNANTSSETADGAHPTVTANVPGFTGHQSAWVTESFDLSSYAGNESVLVSFRYVTDWAFVETGWYVRNVTVAGESVPNDAEAFLSEREATGDRIEYQFSFIGVKHSGKYQVRQLDMRTFGDEEQAELDRFLRNGNFDRVVVAATWAAEPGESGRVPVGAELAFREDQRGNGPPANDGRNGNGNGHGNGNGNGNGHGN